MIDLDVIGSEVYAVLSNVSKERYNKISPNVLKTFEKYKELSKNVTIIPDLEFEKQNISKEAKDIIFVIALNYWLTEEEKKEVIKKLKKNDELKNKTFSYENLFKKMSEESIQQETTDIVEKYKEKWYIKILNKIKKFFKH